MQAAQLTPLLAGTQCTQCGYPSCAAYAQALTTGAPTNLCRPGGQRVAIAIAHALAQTPQPPAQPLQPATIASINHADCIGCTLCLQACPTQAITGAPKRLHTALVEDCTGCGLCLPPCPVDCITLVPAPPHHALTQQMADGSATPAAASATWARVNAAATRRGVQVQRTQAAPRPVASASIPALPPHLAAKIEAARAKSAQKYAAKGPLKTPKALAKAKS